MIELTEFTDDTTMTRGTCTPRSSVTGQDAAEVFAERIYDRPHRHLLAKP